MKTRRSLIVAGVVAAVAGFALLAIGLAVAGVRAVAAAYLVGFAWTASTALGALVLLMIGHVSGATWFVAMRRYVEAATAAVPLLIPLFVPVLLALRWAYPWAAPHAEIPDALREVLARKSAYLNPPFFAARAFVFLASWSAIAVLLARWSAQHDERPSPALVTRMRTLSAAAMPWIAISLTFAAFDWLMSLEPAWYSNAYGFYWFSGGFVGGVALLSLSLAPAKAAGVLPAEVGDGHVSAVGRVQLASVVFWAYIAFTQYLIIWIADLPDEVAFFRERVHGPWLAVTWVLAVGHFAAPFLLLLQRAVTRHAPRLALLAAWLLAMHAVDAFWMVEPASHPTHVPIPWLDLAALLAQGGCALAVCAWRFGAARPVPVNDPLLARSLRYRSR